MSDENEIVMCVRCGNEAGRSAVAFGMQTFCSPVCFGVWGAGRDLESLSRIDALEASNDANLAVANEAKRLLGLREQQLADCTRAMNLVSTGLKHELAPHLRDNTQYWSATRVTEGIRLNPRS